MDGVGGEELSSVSESGREAGSGNDECMVVGNGRSVSSREDKMTYTGSGGKHSIHGITYQLKLLMMFILRAVASSNYPSFRLATEIDDAHKFDDVVFSYPKNKGGTSCGRFYRLLQAKHTSADTNIKMVGAKDLLNERGSDFSLQKYFESYRKIIAEGKLVGKDDEIKDLILCTNMGFKFGSRTGNFKLIEEAFETVANDSEEKDDILATKLLKFKDEFDGKDELFLLLRKCYTRLPCKFAECVLNDVEYCHEQCATESNQGIQNLYKMVFQKEVVDLTSGLFHSNFIDNKSLSEPARHYRDALKSEYFKSRNNVVYAGEDAFRDEMRRKVLKISGFPIGQLHSIENPKKLAKKVCEKLRRKESCNELISIEDKSVLADNIVSLINSNVLHERDGELRFTKEFIEGVGLNCASSNFRKHLFGQLSCFKMDTNGIEDYRFESKHGTVYSEHELEGTTMEEEMDDFLRKLVFAMNQPNECDLDDTIMKEINRFFNRIDIENIYGRFLVRMLNWMKAKTGIYFTKEEAKSFFDGLKQEILGSIVFDLKDPVSNFTGRDKELKNLHEALTCREDVRVKAVISQSTSVSGLGGIGKSELARMYAKIHGSEYQNILWINSETAESLESSFRRLAFDRLGITTKSTLGKEKEIESIVEEIYQYIRGKKNLIIFDNAIQFRAVGNNVGGIQKYLPCTSTGGENYFIITSRNQTWKNSKVFNLIAFTDEEAIEFFKGSIWNYEYSIENDARRLSDMLGNFPLAMQQAASYINETDACLKNVGKSFGIAEYLKLFDGESKAMLSRMFSDDCDDLYTRTTFTTWKITLEHISKMEQGQLAISMLNVMSYMDSERIESDILMRILCRTDINNVACALQLLKQYSMIYMMESTASIHRMVQLVTRIDVKDAGYEEEVLKKILNNAQHLNGEHFVSVWYFAERHNSLVEQYCVILHRIFRNISNTYPSKSVITFGKKLRNTLEGVVGISHESTLRLNYELSSVLFDVGSFHEAYEILQSSMELAPKVFGDVHFETFLMMTKLIGIVAALGKYDEEKTLMERVFEIGRNHLGENSPFTLLTKKHLAEHYRESGMPDKASKLYKELEMCLVDPLPEELDEVQFVTLIECFDISSLETELLKRLCEKAQNYPVTYELFRSRKNLGRALANKGEYKVALEYFSKMYEKYKSHLGDQDRIVVSIKCDYSALLLVTGAIDDSLEISKEAYEFQDKFLGKTHRETNCTMELIASALSDKGDYEESLRFFEEVFFVECKILGEHHQNTLDTKRKIGEQHLNLGHYQEALEILECIYEKQKAHPGRIVLNVISASISYAKVLFYLGQFEKFRNLISEVIKYQFPDEENELVIKWQTFITGEKILSKLKLEVESLLEALIDAKRQYSEVDWQQIFEHIAKIESDVRLELNPKNALNEWELRHASLIEFCSPEHVKVVDMNIRIGETLNSMRKRKEALEILKDSYERLCSRFGEVHLFTLDVKFKIGFVLLCQIEIDESLKCFYEVYRKQRAILGESNPITKLTKALLNLLLKSKK